MVNDKSLLKIIISRNKNSKKEENKENQIINQFSPPYLPDQWNTFNQSQLTHNCYSYFLNDLFNTNVGNLHSPGVFDSIINNKQINSNFLKNHSKSIIMNVINDNPEITYVPLEQTSNFKCKKNYYRGMCLIDLKFPNYDFHFIRQDCLMITTLRFYKLISKNLELDKKNKINLMINIFKNLNTEYYLFLEKKLKNLSDSKKLKFIYENSFTWSHKRGIGIVSNKDASNNFIIDPLKSDWNYQDNLNYLPICFFMVPNNIIYKTHSTNINFNYDWINFKRNEEVGINDTDSLLIKEMIELID